MYKDSGNVLALFIFSYHKMLSLKMNNEKLISSG